MGFRGNYLKLQAQTDFLPEVQASSLHGDNIGRFPFPKSTRRGSAIQRQTPFESWFEELLIVFHNDDVGALRGIWNKFLELATINVDMYCKVSKYFDDRAKRHRGVS